MAPPINDNLRREFEHRYEAIMMLSDKSYRRVRGLTISDSQRFMSDPRSSYYPDDRIEDVEMIEICLPRDRLSDLLKSQDSYLFTKEREERKLREEYPALRSAWEQYQLILALVK